MLFTKRQIKTDVILGISLFLLCPALAIVYIIVQAYSGKYNNLTVLSLSIAMVALFTPPFADIYRHTLMYFYYENFSNSIFQSNDKDFIFYTLTNICARNGIPFEYVSFLFVFICYQISFFLFKKVYEDVKNKLSNRKIFCIFLCFVLMVPFIAILNGLRMPLASYIALLSWFFIYTKQYFKGACLFVIALSTHFGSWLFLPLIIFTAFSNLIKINRTSFLIVSVVLLVVGGIFLHLIPQSFLAATELDGQVEGYMVNNDERFDATMSLNGRIAMYLERLPLLAALFLVISKKLCISEQDKSIVYVAIWIALLYHPFIVLFRRYCFFVDPLLIFIILKGQVQSGYIYKPLKVLLVSCVIMTLSYVHGFRETFSNTKHHKMLYPAIVTIPTMDTYENFKDALIPK